MPDREKVEEWARSFKAYVDELDIARDDYRGIMEYIDDALALLREQDDCENCAIAIEDALALLREQAPVAPSEMDVSPILMEYRCGACRCLVGAESAIRNDVGFRHAYCPECGKKVLWHG